jgi:hypothetical protein
MNTNSKITYWGFLQYLKIILTSKPTCIGDFMSVRHEMIVGMINLGRLKFVQKRGVIGTLLENLRNCAYILLSENKMLSIVNLD